MLRALLFTFKNWKKNTIQKAIKTVPGLESFVERAEPYITHMTKSGYVEKPIEVIPEPKYVSNIRGVEVIDNLLMSSRADSKECRQPELENIVEIIDGMGSRFSCNWAGLMFWDIVSADPYQPGEVISLRETRPYIRLQFEVQKKSIRKRMDVCFEKTLDPVTGLTRPLTKHENDLLDSLHAKILTRRCASREYPEFEPGQPHDYQLGKPIQEACNAVSARYYFPEIFSSLSFPYQVFDDPYCGDKGSASRKNHLSRHFKPKGFEIGSALSGTRARPMDNLICASSLISEAGHSGCKPLFT